MKRSGVWGLAAALMVASAAAQTPEARSWAGEYTASQMELVAGLKLRAEGTFLYGLTVGSLDERAGGTWKVVGDRIVLTSDPRPKAPTVVADRVEANPGKPFAIRVIGPNGRDVPGVDFQIDFDGGEPLQHYTPGSAWSVPTEEKRAPRFITFSMEQYRLKSDRLPLDARPGRTAIFKLIPNDFGVADFTDSYAVRDGDTLTLFRPQGEMKFRRKKD